MSLGLMSDSLSSDSYFFSMQESSIILCKKTITTKTDSLTCFNIRLTELCGEKKVREFW